MASGRLITKVIKDIGIFHTISMTLFLLMMIFAPGGTMLSGVFAILGLIWLGKMYRNAENTPGRMKGWRLFFLKKKIRSPTFKEGNVAVIILTKRESLDGGKIFTSQSRLNKS